MEKVTNKNNSEVLIYKVDLQLNLFQDYNDLFGDYLRFEVNTKNSIFEIFRRKIFTKHMSDSFFKGKGRNKKFNIDFCSYIFSEIIKEVLDKDLQSREQFLIEQNEKG